MAVGATGKRVESTYLYLCFAGGGQLLYVGITNDVERRKRDHAKDKFWWPDVAEMTVRAFATEAEAKWAEWAIIATNAPTYNRALSPPHAPATAACHHPLPARETFPEFASRWLTDRARALRRSWDAIPTRLAVSMGINMGVIFMASLVHFTGLAR